MCWHLGATQARPTLSQHEPCLRKHRKEAALSKPREEEKHLIISAYFGGVIAPLGLASSLGHPNIQDVFVFSWREIRSPRKIGLVGMNRDPSE